MTDPMPDAAPLVAFAALDAEIQRLRGLFDAVAAALAGSIGAPRAGALQQRLLARLIDLDAALTAAEERQERWLLTTIE